MTDLELFEKIKYLDKIIPARDYAASSRILILMAKSESFEISEDTRLKNQLASMKMIMPSADYSLKTRLSILESVKLKHKLRNIFSITRIFGQFTNYGLSVSLAALLLAVVITGGYKYITPSSSLSAADNKALIAEAGTISKDIDIHIQEIEYYARAADKTNLALNEASGGGPGHLNDKVIQREADQMNSNGYPSNSGNVDELLDKAIF